VSSEKLLSEDTLKLVSQALSQKYGAVYAERWLEDESRKRTKHDLPTLRRASDLAPSVVPISKPLSGPVRLLPSPEVVAVSVSPEQARQEALERFEAHAEAHAAKLRTRVGFEALVLRSDRRARLEQFHTSLVQLALVVAVKRGYKGACTLTVHTVMELVGYCLGVRSSSTLYSYLHVLRELGLLDFRGHVTTITLPGEDGTEREVNRCDGALLCIRLGGCKAAKLSRFDFRETPRDLQGDISRGHTAFRLIRKVEESQSYLESKKKLQTLILWSLNPAQLFSENPLEHDPSDFRSLVPNGYPTEIFDVPSSKNRNQAVDVAAGAMAKALGDTRSLSFYRRLLWQLLRAHDRGWDFFGTVYTETVRVLADKREGYAKKTGALLTSRLKKSGCWEELWRDQDQWVGRPVVA
jgi:hypothetical protein